MELDNIEKLVEKYFEGNTTVAEEAKLKLYFSNEAQVAPHLKAYTTMFTYFAKAKEECYTGKLPVRTPINYAKWVSVAAAVVLVCGIYMGNAYLEKQQATYAYNETKKAMRMLAENFERGTEKVAYLQEFEITKQKIYKHK
ncbi:hypothetical protein U1E44_12445 [Arenibacter sp. GZD96]|uniref:hypothetical protein n=1 Tax=Aurantibrevibacter litoralis TaxID=3106030 RepID=UPI002AFEE296|nr:hypothetical protein [Arenibacter sp. GZD-96]MEA1786903.1 hypothetical protein [Arenibacter sp. GZD-96]